MADAALAGVTFRAPLMLLADGLGTAIDDFVYHREVAVADMAFGIKAGRIEAGTVSAQRFGYTAIVAGRHALTVEHITRLGDDQAPDWPTGRGWKVTVEGRPSMVLDPKIATHGEDETDQGCLGTAMHAVHAIAPVCAAAPGIRTFLDLPVIAGRGVLLVERPVQELVYQRGPKRALRVVGGARVAALDVLVVLHGVARRLQRCGHLAGMTRMHPVVTG
jgi:2,4-diaminopentanoate dehydrogenase